MKQQFKHKTSGELYHIGKDQKQGTNLINSITGSEYFLPGYYEQKDVDELFTPVKETEQEYFELTQDGKTIRIYDREGSCMTDYESSNEPLETETFFDWCIHSYNHDVIATPTSKEGLEDGFTFSLFNSDEEYNYYDIDLKGVAIGQLKVLKGESQAILTRINKD